MRYIYDKEFRVAPPDRARRSSTSFAAPLRYELSQRNRRWAVTRGLAHEVCLGTVPSVLYREDEHGNHGNFLSESYKRIQRNPDWLRRLGKIHTSAGRALLSHDRSRRELDSSNSSDALLMNIFCHPDTLTSMPVRTMLALDAAPEPVFGFKPRVPLRNGRQDCTEIDLRIGDLHIEAKLTEYDFQMGRIALIERYRHLEEVFDVGRLELEGGRVRSYQLIRGVLAAYSSPGARFCVLCDARRPDLSEDWHKVLLAVKIADLRCRLLLLTWQELAAVLPEQLKLFLGCKYGISP